MTTKQQVTGAYTLPFFAKHQPILVRSIGFNTFYNLGNLQQVLLSFFYSHASQTPTRPCIRAISFWQYQIHQERRVIVLGFLLELIISF